MASFNLNSITAALGESDTAEKHGVDFSGKSLKLNNKKDAQVIVDAIDACKELHYLTLTGNTLGVEAAEAIAEALKKHPEFKLARWSDMFTGRMKTEIPPALSALGNGMIAAGTRLSVLDLSDNAFGPIGVEGLAKLLQSDVCSQLQELRLNNNGLGITGGRLLAKALTGASPPRLRVFIAGRNRLENDGAKALAQVFQRMGSLEEIAMPQNGIYHAGITALSEAFKHNPQLRTLNLNDNTIGWRGADAIADSLPKLRALKDVNFGDCLLKSRGAKALAKGFKDNSVLLETLDLSHNEIGRDACSEVVDCITALPDSHERLTKVVLAGNSLGGMVNKKSMRERLGDCAELSDGENSEDEYVTGSDESSEEDEGDKDEDQSEDSATEDARHIESCMEATLVESNSSYQEVLDSSGVEEVESDVGRFLKHPTQANLQCLGPNAAILIDAHLQGIKEPMAAVPLHVEALLKVSGLAGGGDTARALYPLLLARTGGLGGASGGGAARWLLANCMLVGLGLIKSENKQYEIKWDLPNCYRVLSSVIDGAYFPSSLRETLLFFIKAKREKLESTLDISLSQCPNLC